MSLYSMFQTNSNLETEGVELNYGNNGKGVDTIIIVGRAGGANKDYQKALTAAMRPYRKQLQTNTLDEAVFNKALLEVYLKTVIKGARGLVDSEGNDLEPNTENLRKVLTDLPDLFNDIKEQAAEGTLFRTDTAELVAKNS